MKLTRLKSGDSCRHWQSHGNIPVIFQVASWLAVLSHPGHRIIYDIVIYAPGDSLPCRRDPS
ncbi:hypothetical protein EAE89_10855 [Photorhabdus heterorhabditis]|nr:hypothetical protein [Photorhabdus heterorhabditis]